MLNLRDPHILRLSQRTRTTAATTGWESQAPMTTLMDPYLDTEIAMDSMWIHEQSEEEGSEYGNYAMVCLLRWPFSSF
jgi:hypothetical protein